MFNSKENGFSLVELIVVLTITINGTNEPPKARDDYDQITVGGPSISKNSTNGTTSNDNDVEGTSLTVNGVKTGTEEGSGTEGTVGLNNYVARFVRPRKHGIIKQRIEH